jgi:phenylglyoxylate dehydrogenase alpha subunit
LIKIKTFRPYPLQAMLHAVSKVKAIGVVDRSVSYGWNTGPVYQETLSTLYHMKERIPAVSFIGGLAGADITEFDFARVIETVAKALKGDVPRETIWINE